MSASNYDYEPKAVTLKGKHIDLEPLLLQHAVQLSDAGQSEEIWHHTLDKPVNLTLMTSYVERALAEQEKGTSIPFAVGYKSDFPGLIQNTGEPT